MTNYLNKAPDPPLTELGQLQASKINENWKKESRDGMPLPTRFYVSPLSRACLTLELSYKDLISFNKCKPTVIESLREGLNIWYAIRHLVTI